MVRTRFALILNFRMVAHKAACHTRNRDFKKRKKVVGRVLPYFLTIFSMLRHVRNASETS